MSITLFNKAAYNALCDANANRVQKVFDAMHTGMQVISGYTDSEYSLLYLQTNGRLTQEIANAIAKEFNAPVPVYSGSSGDTIAVQL